MFMEVYEKHYFYGLNFMRKLLLFIIIAMILPACGKSGRYTAKVVKPKYHHRWYDRKKDRHTPRTKTIKVQN
jgi:hypothetical protein